MSKHLKKGLIISCQALEGEPLFGYDIMGRMAYAAVEGGAVGIRANGAHDIALIKKEVDVPIIGLQKKCYEGYSIYITPTTKEADILGKTECDIIAIDATLRLRPEGQTLNGLVSYIRKHYPDKYLMADIATLSEAINADELGFDYVSSTLCGYTEETKNIKIPDYSLLKQMTEKIKHAKVIAEGGIWSREDLEKVIDTGVYAVVVGTAVTRPREITKRFTEAFK